MKIKRERFLNVQKKLTRQLDCYATVELCVAG